MKPTELELGFLREHFSGEELAKAVSRFECGEPLAYIIGEWYFYGLTFRLNRDCLVPRPDTEHVVDTTLPLLPVNGSFADLCTGSGCIAVSVLANRPDLSAFACDISPGAVEMARQNAEMNGVTVTVGDVREMTRSYRGLTLSVADIFGLSLPAGAFDVIVSNPPYIRSAVIPELDTVRCEPKIALDGGADGMDFYRHIISSFGSSLRRNGAFVFEIGYDQRTDITRIAGEQGFSCEIRKDYGGNDRVAVLKKDGGAG